MGSTSLLLRWEAPTHLGGSGFEVLGYQIKVQYGGTGGFNVHVEDSGSDVPQYAVEELSPDMWHEICVAAITSAGVGAFSPSSRPLLTDRAPRLLRELNAATKQLAGHRAKLQRKRAELLQLARSGTMALPPASSASGRGDGASPGSAHFAEEDGQDDPLRDVGTRGSTITTTGGGGGARLSADDARQGVRRRKVLMGQIASLERRAEESDLLLNRLVEQQGKVDRHLAHTLPALATVFRALFSSWRALSLSLSLSLCVCVCVTG